MPHSRFCEKIISGGQTGADRAALDFAIKYGYPYGGWLPKGRKAEDGPVPLKYKLSEMTYGGYIQRTKQNVDVSGGTLIVNMGKLDGGTLATRTFAEKSGKPCLVVQLNQDATEDIADAATKVLAWLRSYSIKTLNVAGPRESKRPGIYRLTFRLLETVEGF